jgi:hypothetical protein
MFMFFPYKVPPVSFCPRSATAVNPTLQKQVKQRKRERERKRGESMERGTE